jgi:quinol monooxygenase YgiN
MHVIAGKFTVKPERVQDLVKLSLDMYGPSRAEAGCISYNFYEDKGTPNGFLFFEEWKDQAAIDEHFQTPHFRHFMDEFPSMIVGQPLIRIYEVSEVKTL